MSCRRFQYIITTSPQAERSAEEAAFVETHRSACSACAGFEQRMHALEAALRAVPEQTAGPDFAPSVMARVRRDPLRQGLWIRMFGPAAPAHALRHAYAVAGAAAFCLVLAVGGVVVHNANPERNSDVTVVAGLAAPTFTDASDLVERNQFVAMSQPLSDDPGVQLVSYTPSEE
jgi:hypothetical protein